MRSAQESPTIGESGTKARLPSAGLDHINALLTELHNLRLVEDRIDSVQIRLRTALQSNLHDKTEIGERYVMAERNRLQKLDEEKNCILQDLRILAWKLPKNGDLSGVLDNRGKSALNGLCANLFDESVPRIITHGILFRHFLSQKVKNVHDTPYLWNPDLPNTLATYISMVCSNDTPECVRIHNECNEEQWSEDDFDKKQRMPRNCFYAARVANQPVGSMQLKLAGACLANVEIEVPRYMRGFGIESSFIKNLKDKLHESNKVRTMISVHVRETNLELQMLLKGEVFLAAPTIEYGCYVGSDEGMIRMKYKSRQNAGRSERM